MALPFSPHRVHTSGPLALRAAVQSPEYYILRVNNFDQETKDNLDEWIYFLKNEKLPENYRARGLKEAAEKLDVLKLSGEERREYDRYLESLMDRASFYRSTYGDGRREGRKEGLEEGEKKGLEKGKLETARNMLRKGMSVATITEVTGLPRQKLTALRKKKA